LRYHTLGSRDAKRCPWCIEACALEKCPEDVALDADDRGNDAHDPEWRAPWCARFFDKEDRRIDYDTWQSLIGDVGYASVAFDELPDGIKISTRWNGVRLKYGKKGTSGDQMFEVMVIRSRHSNEPGYEFLAGCDSLDEAMALHNERLQRKRGS
jgi:hypothetical protein